MTATSPLIARAKALAEAATPARQIAEAICNAANGYVSADVALFLVPNIAIHIEADRAHSRTLAPDLAHALEAAEARIADQQARLDRIAEMSRPVSGGHYTLHPDDTARIYAITTGKA